MPNSKIRKIIGFIDSQTFDAEVSFVEPGQGGVPIFSDEGWKNEPHVLVVCEDESGIKREKKIGLGDTALHASLEDFTKHVALAIAEFRDEVDDVVMG